MSKHHTIDDFQITNHMPNGAYTEHDTTRIITDILKENYLKLHEFDGPYTVGLAVSHYRLVLSIQSGDAQVEIPLSIKSLRSTLKDYNIICESYLHVVQSAETKRIEAIDMGRRGLHNEGAEQIINLLAPHAETDLETARHLFSVIYTLQKT